MNEISKMLLEHLAVATKRKTGQWLPSSTHTDMLDLSIDNKGEIGEKLLAAALRRLGHEVEVDRTTDAGEKPWDLRVDRKILIEVKTATLGRSNPTFQHEHIVLGRGWDALALLDVAPDDLYLTLAAKWTVPFRKPSTRWTINKKKLHQREGGEFKWDFHLQDVADRRIVTLDDVEDSYQAMLKDLRVRKRTRRT